MIRAANPEDLPKVREIFLEYAAWVGDDICFESFERELAGLPGDYLPPAGGLLLATAIGNGARSEICHEGLLTGCAAFRRFTHDVAEMKRLYVRPAFRGSGLGRDLVRQIAGTAESAGYRALRLDTLPRMDRAIAMYRGMGFREIAPYGHHPSGAICFELGLSLRL